MIAVTSHMITVRDLMVPIWLYNMPDHGNLHVSQVRIKYFFSNNTVNLGFKTTCQVIAHIPSIL